MYLPSPHRSNYSSCTLVLYTQSHESYGPLVLEKLARIAGFSFQCRDQSAMVIPANPPWLFPMTTASKFF